MTELLESLVVGLYSEGLVSDQKTLKDLLRDKKSAYVLIGERPGDLQSCANVNNFVDVIRGEESSEERKVQKLLEAWESLVKEANETDDASESRVIVLPRLVDAKTAMSLFSQIRLYVLGSVNSPSRPVILVGDYITFQQMNREMGDYSPLAKELSNIYLLDRYAAHTKAIQWLSGGDMSVTRSLIRDNPEQNDAEILRCNVHRITSEMLSNEETGLKRRIERLISIDAHPKINLSTMFAELYGFLPGSFNPSDPVTSYLQVEKQQNSRWFHFSDLSEPMRILISGGLIGFEPHDDGVTYYRLRSPLLAYALARLGQDSGRWQPQLPKLYQILEKPHRFPPITEEPTSLDHFLDFYLGYYKRSGKCQESFPERENWMLASSVEIISREISDQIDGHWWKRIEFSEKKGR